MQLKRNEVMTGLLVVATIAVLTGVLILLGAPGLFRPLVTYRIYFDNAAGIKLGAPVLLAGRKIGQVESLHSPVTKDEAQRAAQATNARKSSEDRLPARPPGGPPPPPVKYEVRIDVQVDRTAAVYKDAKPRLFTLGLLGEIAIDFTQGSETSGDAQDGEIFAGERVPDFGTAIAQVLHIIQPAAREATATMKELQTTAQNLSRITDESSQLNMAIAQFRTFAENLTNLTARDSSLSLSLTHVEELSRKLTENDNIEVTLQNFRDASEKLQSTMSELGPAGRNIRDLTETVRSQPWRLVWPSTKKYPSAEPTPSEETITIRKTTRTRGSASATPSPSPRRRGR
jgi:ABC-type transporter Mla subunit MlaD